MPSICLKKEQGRKKQEKKHEGEGKKKRKNVKENSKHILNYIYF